jgi:Dolichyl-phosphate-mannose-protein mannosyltransferase
LKGRPEVKKKIFFACIVSISALMFCLGIALLFLRKSTLARLLAPLISHYAPNGRISANTTMVIFNFLHLCAFAALAAGCAILFLLVLERHLLKKLPAEAEAVEDQGSCRVTMPEVAGIFCISILGLVIRLHGITRGLVYDEIFTAYNFVNAKSLLETVSTYIYFNNHIAYSILARFAEQLFGASPWVLRLPALVLGICGIVMLWYFSRRLFNRSIALCAAFLLAISFPHVEWSVSARGYSGVIICVLISNFFFLRSLLRKEGYSSLFFILASTGALYFHLYAAVNCAAQAGYLVVASLATSFGKNSLFLFVDRRRHQRLAGSFLWISLATCILYAPVMSQLALNIVFTRETTVALSVFPQLLAMVTSSNAPLWMLLNSILAAAGFLFLWKSRKKYFMFFVFIFGIPLSMLLVSPIQPRFYSFLLPYFVVLLACGVYLALVTLIHRRNRALSFSGMTLCAAALIAIGYINIEESWNHLGQDFYHEVARNVFNRPEGNTRFCAVGLGSELYPYFTKSTVFLPADIKEFEKIRSAGSSIKCACYEEWCHKPQLVDLIRYIKSIAVSSEKFGNIVVYTVK